jgi:hypothetical protein
MPLKPPCDYLLERKKRLSGRRKAVTLIAAFWCVGDQAVICADAQESWGDYKTSVTKLRPQEIGPYQVAYAGSGLSDLVDRFEDALELSLAQSQFSTPSALRAEIERTLVDFYETPAIKNYPIDPSDPNSYVSGVICVRIRKLEKVLLFKFSKTIALPVTTYVLRGMEVPIYDHIIQRLYRRDILPLQAQLLGIHLLTQASQTSTHVGEPFSVVYAMTHGMFADDREDERRLLIESLTRTQRAMDDLLLMCTETRVISDFSVKHQLKMFRRQIMELRKDQTKKQRELFKRYLHGTKP